MGKQAAVRYLASRRPRRDRVKVALGLIDLALLAAVALAARLAFA